MSRILEEPHDLPHLPRRPRHLSVACAAPAFAGPQPPAGWTDGYVVANGIRIHYWRTGAGTSKPPLVLAHGSSDDGLCWTNMAKEIQDGYDIIMFDARGHGLSDPPTPSDPPDVQVEDLGGLIRALKLERADADGTLDGERLGRQLCSEVPDVARAVILEDPALSGPAPAARRRRSQASKNAAPRSSPATTRPRPHSSRAA